MPRTYIVTEDGTQFVERSTARRRVIKGLILAATLLALPFIAGGLAGIYIAVTEVEKAPGKIIILNEGDKIMTKEGCKIVKAEGDSFRTVRCD